MKFAEPSNPNYAAVITSVKAVVALEGRDRIVGVPVFGSQAIVEKGWEVGDLGVYFPAEVQFSDEYARVNNLYRDATKNADQEEVGYLEDNRRLKAIKLGGHRSDAMLMPLSSLEYTGINIGTLQEGDTFDTLNGREIVRKYEIRRPNEGRGDKQQRKITRKFNRVDAKMLPEHIDTENYWRNLHRIPGWTEDKGSPKTVIVTQKLHGTSIRIGRTVVNRKLSWIERLLRKCGVNVATTTYEHVVGSRKVIKDPEKVQNHFYGTDVWSEYGRQLDGLIPDGFVVYGELIGWTLDRQPIQKGYTYGIPEGFANLYVYRVAQVNPQGLVTDLPWDQVKKFCRDRGLDHVPELWRGPHSEFDVDEWMDVRYDRIHIDAVPLGDAKVDEGVCIRVDTDELLPFILKAKSPAFLRHESAILDQGEADLESAESVLA